MQNQLLKVFELRVPVLVGVHGKCIGGGVDLTSMCDVRYCSSDAEFNIKEIDIGMAADIGTLQFFTNSTGN
jgi:enoyl-CoA hydratase